MYLLSWFLCHSFHSDQYKQLSGVRHLLVLFQCVSLWIPLAEKSNCSDAVTSDEPIDIVSCALLVY